MKFFSKEKPVNPLKSEHLKEGVSPIIACIGTPEQFEENHGIEHEVFANSSPWTDIDSNSNVNFYENPEKLSERNFKNAGHGSYVISSIDSSNKFSKSFKDCTGLLVTGIDKKTGKNISFLSHQNPDFIFEYGQEEGVVNKQFGSDLNEQINKLKNMCIEGTIDAVIVGGNYFEGADMFQKNYLRSIKTLQKETGRVLGFEPIVITGPKTESGKGHQDDIFYDNEHRRLYISRSEVGKESTKSYLPSDIEQQRKGW